MDVRIDTRNDAPVVILRDATKSDMYLPIWVGEPEAASIQMAIEKRNYARPLTHDLIVHLLDLAGITPIMLRIDRIVDQTYFAEFVVEANEERVDVDCRPSDGIALALRKNIPIYVDDRLLYEIKFTEGEEEVGEGVDEPQEAFDPEQFKQFLHTITPKDFLGTTPGEGADREG
jgi:hypothetical protein